MTKKPDYDVGTLSVAAGGTTVTGVGSQWVSADIKPGDTLKVQNLDAIIASVNSNTSITLKEPWTGTTLTGSAYAIRYQPDGSRFTSAVRDLVDQLGNGNIQALSGLDGSFGKIPRFTGTGAMDLIDQSTLATQTDLAAREQVLKSGVSPVVLVATGQSGMLAHGAEGSLQNGDRSTEPGVYVIVYNNTNPSLSYWLEGGPDHPDWPWRISGRANAGIAYSHARSIRRETKRPVYVVMDAAGGQPSSAWQPGGARWSVLLNKCLWARSTPELSPSKSNGPLADYFDYHQGEGDANYLGGSGPVFLSNVESMIDRLRTPQGSFDNLLVLSRTTPVMIGELFQGGTNGGAPGVGSSTDDRNAEIRLFEFGRDPYITNVSSTGYTASVDNLHMDARCNEDFGGRRYYEAAMRLPKTGGMSSYQITSLADDVATSLSLPSADCTVHAICSSSTAAQAILGVSGSSVMFIMGQPGTAVEKTTGVLANGAGTDGKLTFSLVGTTLYISNRLGGAYTASIRVTRFA